MPIDTVVFDLSTRDAIYGVSTRRQSVSLIKQPTLFSWQAHQELHNRAGGFGYWGARAEDSGYTVLCTFYSIAWFSSIGAM